MEKCCLTLLDTCVPAVKEIKDMENTNYVGIVEQTKEEKIAMYMKCKKTELAEMLYNCNVIIDSIKPKISSDDAYEDMLKLEQPPVRSAEEILQKYWTKWVTENYGSEYATDEAFKEVFNDNYVIEAMQEHVDQFRSKQPLTP